MSLGKYLKANHGFSDPEVIAKFCEQFGYTEKMVNKIVDDLYPVLLSCQVNDLASFTGTDSDVLWNISIQSKVKDGSC